MHKKEIKKQKKEDSSNKNLHLSSVLYQKIINKLLKAIVRTIDKKKIDNKELDYFIAKKDKIFVYEDTERIVVFNPNGWSN